MPSFSSSPANAAVCYGCIHSRLNRCLKPPIQMTMRPSIVLDSQAAPSAALERKGVRDIWAYLQPPRAILDVGCAGGELLDLIRRDRESRCLWTGTGQLRSRIGTRARHRRNRRLSGNGWVPRRAIQHRIARSRPRACRRSGHLHGGGASGSSRGRGRRHLAAKCAFRCRAAPRPLLDGLRRSPSSDDLQRSKPGAVTRETRFQNRGHSPRTVGAGVGLGFPALAARATTGRRTVC